MTQSNKPKVLKRVVIKEELYALTDDDAANAVILNQMLYWQERTGDTDKYIAEENARAKQEGKEAQIELTHGWFYKSAADLADEIMLGIKEDAVRNRLKKMVDKGWLSERNNPTRPWDRVKQYRVEIRKVDSDLRTLCDKKTGKNLGYHLDGWRVPEIGMQPAPGRDEPAPDRDVRPGGDRDETETAQPTSYSSPSGQPDCPPDKDANSPVYDDKKPESLAAPTSISLYKGDNPNAVIDGEVVDDPAGIVNTRVLSTPRKKKDDTPYKDHEVYVALCKECDVVPGKSSGARTKNAIAAAKSLIEDGATVEEVRAAAAECRKNTYRTKDWIEPGYLQDKLMSLKHGRGDQNGQAISGKFGGYADWLNENR